MHTFKTTRIKVFQYNIISILYSTKNSYTVKFALIIFFYYIYIENVYYNINLIHFLFSSKIKTYIHYMYMDEI